MVSFEALTLCLAVFILLLCSALVLLSISSRTSRGADPYESRHLDRK
jgi:hypothetical protein